MCGSKQSHGISLPLSYICFIEQCMFDFSFSIQSYRPHVLSCIVVKVLLLLIVIKNCNREISDLEDVHLNFNDGDLYDNCICTLKSQRSGKLQIQDLFPRSQDCSTGIRFTTTSTGGTQEKTFNCTESIVENITLDTKGSLSIQLVRFRGGRNGSDDFYYCFMISKRGDLFLKLYLFFCCCFFFTFT